VSNETPAPESAPPTPAPLTVAVVSTAKELKPAPAPAPATPSVVIARTHRSASRPALPIALLNAARRIADTHRAEHEAPITAAQLAPRMGVALPVATAALGQL
jgi:hypothetical protein